MSHTADDDQRQQGRSAVQKGAAGMGILFLLMGVLGFVPGVTTNYSELAFAGHHSTALLFGAFQVSVLHNLLHLGLGAAGLFFAGTPLRARNYLFVGSMVYAVLFFYGVDIEFESAANIVPFNGADNFLHVTLAAVMLTLSLVLDRGPDWSRVVRQGRARV